MFKRVLCTVAISIALTLSMLIVNAFNLTSSGFELITNTGKCETSTLGMTISINSNTTVMAWLVYDGAGNAISSGWWAGTAVDYTTTIGVQNENFTLSAIQTIQARPLTMEIYDLPATPFPPAGYNFQAQYDFIEAAGGTLVNSVTYDPANDVADCAKLPLIVGASASSGAEPDSEPVQIFFDGRINSYDTGNSVVLFGKPDADDAWRLEVYNADTTGMLFVVYPETIAAVAECPASNTLIQNDATTGISLWRLTERTMTAEGVPVCPFQLNAPSTEAGKTYVIIFDTLFPNSYYESGDEWIGN